MALRYFALITFLVLTLSACNQPPSFEEASKSWPYRELSEADRRWLYDYHMTRAGALAWLEDEIYFADEDMTPWRTSDGKFELQNEATGKSYAIDTDKAIALCKSKDGRDAAFELVTKARKETGGEPRPPAKPAIVKGITGDHIKAQSLRYPKQWSEYILYESQVLIDESQKMNDKGLRRVGAAMALEARDLRIRVFGPEFEATKFAGYVYTKITGQQPPDTFEPDYSVGTIQYMINLSRAYWEDGRQGEAKMTLMKAQEYAMLLLGPEHAKTKEVDSILEKMR
jgi:hypothetical protein